MEVELVAAGALGSDQLSLLLQGGAEDLQRLLLYHLLFVGLVDEDAGPGRGQRAAAGRPPRRVRVLPGEAESRGHGLQKQGGILEEALQTEASQQVPLRSLLPEVVSRCSPEARPRNHDGAAVFLYGLVPEVAVLQPLRPGVCRRVLLGAIACRRREQVEGRGHRLGAVVEKSLGGLVFPLRNGWRREYSAPAHLSEHCLVMHLQFRRNDVLFLPLPQGGLQLVDLLLQNPCCDLVHLVSRRRGHVLRQAGVVGVAFRRRDDVVSKLLGDLLRRWRRWSGRAGYRLP
mmetsp:Transcript_43721/g.129412  ORF Transcript_43721/g.129412 Transcript_43721/m.129412 type:complete len:287 (+) Transcript_43721:450-1310(+)